ncbi:MAG: class I SAM-dependent methyltransferase [Bacteroidetes bacterium]|nr:class I SAM-dependent methyltransferase [Bacteroidota bacterium]
MKQNGKVPENMVFLHADAMELPFQEKTFKTIHSQNLLHCLDDTNILLKSLEKIMCENGKMYFTTLVKNNRFADNYLESLTKKGKLVSRTLEDHKTSQQPDKANES